VIGGNVRVFDDLPDEHLKAVLHAPQRSEDVPVAGWCEEQMAQGRQLDESRKAHLHRVRMQGNLAQLVGLHRAGVRSDGDDPALAVATHVLLPQFFVYRSADKSS
jgi:hypothetical protein